MRGLVAVVWVGGCSAESDTPFEPVVPGSTCPGTPSLSDADYLWLRSELERCTCSCCHTAALGGPGVHQWDLDFEPMWIDSASGWSLDVLAGNVESDDQFLPTEDPERLAALIAREGDRRDAANDAP